MAEHEHPGGISEVRELKYCNSDFTFRYIFAKWKQLRIALTRRKSKACTINKDLMYEAILKPIWTYGMKLWGTASTSNTEILERFQSKALGIILDALWYVPLSSKLISSSYCRIALYH
jgi:hypothetical protein